MALPLPAAPAAGIAALSAPWRLSAPALKWVAPEYHHFTLRFLGETETGLLPALSSRLERCAAGHLSFTLRLGAALRIPPGRSARVLALGLAEGEAALAALAGDIEAGCVELGWAPEARAFRAHLTLARARRGEGLPPSPFPAVAAPALQPAWRVERFSLFVSELRPEGPTYQILERFTLGA